MCLVYFVLPAVKIQGTLLSQKYESHHAAAGKRIWLVDVSLVLTFSQKGTNVYIWGKETKRNLKFIEAFSPWEVRPDQNTLRMLPEE